ncbi:hypothetical protein Cni_G08720 [Canna indica]|uniref:PWWP domain-containing protein n=1 Tax=Canna indica TaxID=4628 RepID=A0AAQ3K137_9LILI|nr:hypothetical protein Cni_G08720 [Canna indica]
MEKKPALFFDSPPIPKRRRLPRSRRAPTSLRGSPSELLNSNVDCFCNITDGSDQASNELLSIDTEETPQFPLSRCGIYCNGKDKGIILEPVGSINQFSLWDPLNTVFRHAECKNGSNSNDRLSTHSSAGTSSIYSDEFLWSTRNSVNSWLAPGSVVWAKTPLQEWWPAEVMDEGSLHFPRNNHDGHVPVQLYGSKKHVWLEPTRDLSKFDYCYEERSKNPLQAFQEALNQALCNHVHRSRGATLGGCLKTAKISYHDDSCDAWQTSNRSSDFAVEGRGQRKRKAKVHFDEIIHAEKPKRRVRRLRIMRYLGLMAPVGSPFSLQH